MDSPIRITKMPSGVYLKLPQSHLELQRILTSLGGRVSEQDYSGPTFHFPKIIPEIVEAVFTYWPYIVDRENVFPRRDPVRILTTDVLPSADLLRDMRKLYPIIEAAKNAQKDVEEKIRPIPEEVRLALGIYLVQNQYDPAPRVGGSWHERVRSSIVRAIVDYTNRQDVRQENVVRIPIESPIRTGLKSVIYESDYLGHQAGLAAEHIPIMVAYALAGLDSRAVLEDGELVISYPSWVCEAVEDPIVMQYGDRSIPVASCVLTGGYVSEIVHVSFIGSMQTVRAAWASLFDARKSKGTIRFLFPGYNNIFSAQRTEGMKYRSYTNDNELPESGVVHLVIDREDLTDPKANASFIHITGNGLGATPDYEKFAQQLEKALIFGFDPAWAADIWKAAENLGLIRAVRAHGCRAYEISVRNKAEPWGRIIGALTTGQDPGTWENFTYEMSGQLIQDADVDQDIEEEDNEDE